MLLYRVFPSLDGAKVGEPGHPLHVNPDQGLGRWDDPDRYLVRYLATGPSAAVGEAFAGIPTWSPAMLAARHPVGAMRALATYRFDEERNPICDLDDAKALLARGLRPTEVVARNRPRTQAIAGRIFAEGRWAGISWWSLHRPQWTLVALWSTVGLEVVEVKPLAGHPALEDAALVLGKPVDGL